MSSKMSYRRVKRALTPKVRAAAVAQFRFLQGFFLFLSSVVCPQGPSRRRSRVMQRGVKKTYKAQFEVFAVELTRDVV